MAVIESKGDGFSLFNGVKLPSLPDYDKETYPYAYVVSTSNISAKHRILLCTAPLQITGNNLITTADTTVAGSAIVSDYVGEWGEFTTTEKAAGVAYGAKISALWTNYDILNTGDNSVYLYASDPIPLDGMNVIEWDGGTEGLERTAESTTSAPRYKVSDTIVPIDGDNYIVVSVASGERTVVSNIPTYYESGGYYWVGMRRTVGVFWAVETTVNGTSPGVQFYSNSTNSYHSLFAYPIETTVDYTITYQTEHGTAPNSKTVTVNAGESYTLTADDLPTLEAEGYAFKGWTANGTAVSVGDTISADTTLTAVWEIVPVELPEWTSGNGYALYGGKKLPKLPTDAPYAVIGYDETQAQYKLIASSVELTYGTKTYVGEGVFAGFIFTAGGGAAIYYLNDNEWVKHHTTSSDAGGGMITDFTIEETGWANFDIDILNEDGSTERTFEARTSYALDGFSVLEWDGNTKGLTQGGTLNKLDFTKHYRVSDATLPDLGSLELSGLLIKNFKGVVSETWEGKLSYSPVACEKKATDGLWLIYDWFSHFLYYAEKPNDGLPEAGLYFYHDGTDRTMLFAYKIEAETETKHLDIYIPVGDAWVNKTFYSADGDWKKKRVTEAYQEQDGEWVKIAPSE